MPNYFWYLGLTIISLLVFGLTLWKKKDFKLLPFYFFLVGLAYLFEFIVLVIGQGYVYYPGVLENAYFDSILGSIPSNFLSVPSAAALVAAFQLNFMRMVLIIAVFQGIEFLFLSLDIYNHIWWSSAYTAASLLVLFLIARKWYGMMAAPGKPTRLITLYFINVSVLATFFFILSAFFNTHSYKIGLYADPARDSVFFATAYTFSLSLAMVALVCSKIPARGKMLGVLALLAPDWVLLRLNILNLFAGWHIAGFVMVYSAALLLLAGFNRLIPTTRRIF